MASKSCCVWTWLLLITGAMWITGLTIGIIGAVGYAPVAEFDSNAQGSKCQLYDWQMKVQQCTKWGSCIQVQWSVSHPSLTDSTTTLNATMIVEQGLGWYDANNLVNSETPGNIVNCFVDSTNQSSAWQTIPGQDAKAELIVGWVFFFFATFVWIAFFMFVCCGVKWHKLGSWCVDTCCSCDCDCSSDDSSTYKTNQNINPLFAGDTSNTVYIPPAGTGGNLDNSNKGTAVNDFDSHDDDSSKVSGSDDATPAVATTSKTGGATGIRESSPEVSSEAEDDTNIQMTNVTKKTGGGGLVYRPTGDDDSDSDGDGAGAGAGS